MKATQFRYSTLFKPRPSSRFSPPKIMDSLGDWELLSDDGLLDTSGENHKSAKPNSTSKRVHQFDDYFSPDSSIISGSSIGFDDEVVTKLPIESSVVPAEANTEVLKETDQFVDMKMGSTGMTVPEIDAGEYQVEDQNDAVSVSANTNSPRMSKTAVGWEEEGGGVKIWRWSFTGIGALCSFATVCIVILGSHHHQQSHKPRFQIYATDKRMKQMVHQTTRMNDVSVELGRAHIGYGGYFDSI